MKNLLVGLTLLVSMSSFGSEYWENVIDSTSQETKSIEGNTEASVYWTKVINDAGDEAVQNFEAKAKLVMQEVNIFDKCLGQLDKDKVCLSAIDTARELGLTEKKIAENVAKAQLVVLLSK
jgi:hypothetical protein